MWSKPLTNALAALTCGPDLDAQPVLDQATSIPALGTTYSRGWHYLQTNVPQLPTTGANLLWDLGGINFQFQGVNDTAIVVDPGTSPFAGDFPLATVALHAYITPFQATPLLNWTYFAASADSCGLMGSASNTGLLTPIDPITFNVPLPLTYQDSWAAWDSSVVFSYGAYGTMITPWGDTLSDIIMITWEMGGQGSWHAWYSADNLLDALGTYDPDLNSLQLTQRLPISGTGMTDRFRLAPHLAPNPATDAVQLVVPDLRNGTLLLMDRTGRVVLADRLMGDTHRIQLNGIAPGCYVVQVIDERGITGTTRLVVTEALGAAH